MPVPPREAHDIYRLMLVIRVTDIMIARQGAERDAESVHRRRTMSQILLVVGAVDCDVAGVDHEIRALHRDPGGERRPIIGKVRLCWAQMRVGNLNDAKHAGMRPLASDRLRASRASLAYSHHTDSAFALTFE